MSVMIWNINGRPYTDVQLVEAILKRDALVSRVFFFKMCYPLFASTYNKYYTDCDSVIEFINEIYAYLLYPGKKPHRCKLATFSFKCSFIGWLQYVVENYCHALFSKRVPTVEDTSSAIDRYKPEEESFMQRINSLDLNDVNAILRMMSNDTYRKLIMMRYLEHKEHKEIALVLGLEGKYYYTVHDRAKDQFREALRKEGLL